MTDLIIGERFNGPPGIGNGGYCCGRLAAHYGGDDRAEGLEVTLLRPVPPEQPLQVRPGSDGNGSELIDAAGDVLAKVRAGRPDLEEPVCPEPALARNASRSYEGLAEGVGSGCFVCGPDRSPGDGLRIFPGPVSDELVAAPWTPDPSLSGRDGFLAPEFIWAALDCPGYFGVFQGQELPVALLGRLTVQIRRPVPVGDELIVTGWPVAREGRKHSCGSALFDGTGRCLAIARGLWVMLKKDAAVPGEDAPGP